MKVLFRDGIYADDEDDYCAGIDHYMGFLTQKEMHARLRVLKNKSCMDCGQTFPKEVMDYDHRSNVRKTDNISSMIRDHRPWEEILAEIEKCDLVCANCHRIRTTTRRRYIGENNDGR